MVDEYEWPIVVCGETRETPVVSLPGEDGQWLLSTDGRAYELGVLSALAGLFDGVRGVESFWEHGGFGEERVFAGRVFSPCWDYGRNRLTARLDVGETTNARLEALWLRNDLPGVSKYGAARKIPGEPTRVVELTSLWSIDLVGEALLGGHVGEPSTERALAICERALEADRDVDLVNAKLAAMRRGLEACKPKRKPKRKVTGEVARGAWLS